MSERLKVIAAWESAVKNGQTQPSHYQAICRQMDLFRSMTDHQFLKRRKEMLKKQQAKYDAIESAALAKRKAEWTKSKSGSSSTKSSARK